MAQHITLAEAMERDRPHMRSTNENKTKHYLSFTFDKARVRERLKHFTEAMIVSVSICIRSTKVVSRRRIARSLSLCVCAVVFFFCFVCFIYLVSCLCVLNSLTWIFWADWLLFIYEFLFLEKTDFIVSGSVNCWMCASLVDTVI